MLNPASKRPHLNRSRAAARSGALEIESTRGGGLLITKRGIGCRLRVLVLRDPESESGLTRQQGHLPLEDAELLRHQVHHHRMVSKPGSVMWRTVW